MIVIKDRTDVFTVTASAYVIPVNCVGIMGAGVAREARRRWPSSCTEYSKRCARGVLKPEDVFIQGKLIFFATKQDWRDPSQIEWVRSGLERLRLLLSVRHDLKTVALPPPGCGLGGLNWNAVKSLVEEILGDLPVQILVCRL